MKSEETYAKLLADVRADTGIEAMAADADGLVCVNVDGEYNLNLQLLAPAGRILCFVETAQLPHGAPAPVYRDLLAAGLFGRETAGGFFALEPETETVVYNYLFDLDAAARDPGDFVSTLEKILQLCDVWAERVKRVLAGAAAEAAPEPNSPFITA